MIVLFHITTFSFRGTETATYDYAHYNETILKNKSIIVTPKATLPLAVPHVIDKFQARFQVVFYKSFAELEQLCVLLQGDVIHYMKYGIKDDFVVNSIPMVVHCVFHTKDPHGLVYAGVSESVSKGEHPYVPHIVTFNTPIEEYPTLDNPRGKNFRKQLNIPNDALVFGRHGGADTFNIPLAKDAILKVIKENKNIFFLFAVRPTVFAGIDPVDYNNQIKFIDSFSDPQIKQRFIQTCDAMIHACYFGESFGLSVLEFSYFNKPVITWNGGEWHKQHLTHLGDKVMLYSELSTESIRNVISNFYENKRVKEQGNPKFWEIRTFTPEYVMPIFDKVFLEPVRKMKLTRKES
jgi:glycosyltransferase involved in cell wall biosynthesis